MNYHKIEKTSIANGPGVRCVLWVSGCSLHCKGCHNPETWSFNSGRPFDNEAKKELFDILSKPWIKGITFSGGHPLEPQNVDDVLNLILEIKKHFPHKDIWLYTGLTWESIFYNSVKNDSNHNVIKYCQKKIIEMCDVIVDGAYIEQFKDVTLLFRGSKNQRLINVKESLTQAEVVLYE